MLSKPTWLLGKTEFCWDDIVFAVAMADDLKKAGTSVWKIARGSWELIVGLKKYQLTVSGTMLFEKGVKVDTR